MTPVAVWRLFAFKDGDEAGEHDEVRLLADWQVSDALRWCMTRGYDNIYLARTAVTAEFEKQMSAPVAHRYG